jgi:uncharacterized protein involved in outer membrane biogenesis
MSLTDSVRRLGRHARRAGMMALALIAASIVTFVTVDLGPSIRTRVEKFVSVEIMRPLTMGTLSVRLFDGRVIARDVWIQGYDTNAQPFLKAREIQIAVPLWTLLRRELRIASIEMTDWRVRMEQYPGGRNNVPHLSGRPSTGPSRFTTNISYVRANRGVFSYWDTSATFARTAGCSPTGTTGRRGASTCRGWTSPS